MKHIKKKVNKARLAIVLSGVFLLLLGVCITLGVLLLRNDDTQTKKDPPEILRPDKDGSMVLYYYDEHGDRRVYYPNIADSSTFDYESLYAIEMNDGYKSIYKLTYLCIALEIPYFEERIPLSADATEKAMQLKEYGFNQPTTTTVAFHYTDKDGAEKSHTVRIGSKNINGNGYYFMVDDREYVYTSQNNYYDYALAGFESFIKATLVAEGLPADNGQEPYLTTNFYEWVNTKHAESDDTVTEDAKVIAYADTIVPINKEGSNISSTNRDGYIHSDYESIEIDLASMKGNAGYARLINALVGKNVGVYYDLTSDLSNRFNQIMVTLPSRTSEIDLAQSASKTYTYRITDVEAILTDDGEIRNTGTLIGENNLVRVTYNLYVDGTLYGTAYHGVIDLSESYVSESARTALRACAIGELGSFVDVEVTYTPDNAIVQNYKYIITEIVSIYSKDGKVLNRVTSDAIVSYRFRYMIDGVLGDEEYSVSLDLAAEGEDNEAIKQVLNNKSVGKNLSIVADEYTAYCEYMYDFITYEIARIDFFITSELVSAFRFQNSSDRDPYYGESLYENLMEDEHRLYGLNSSSCESVVKMLGGITTGSSVSSAEGLYGEEVVAVGLTPEVMDKYGLYAYTIYFELPRGVYPLNSDASSDENALDDYGYYDTLGFYLYVSEEQIDGTRYVGSDMYDIVTKMDSDNFLFLEFDFVNFWARRDLILMDIANIENVGLDFMMEDVYGSYDFELIHKTVSVGTAGNHFDKITVSVTPSGNSSGNLLLDYMGQKGYSHVSLTEFYGTIHDQQTEKEYFPDSSGTGNFKTVIRMIYFTRYGGTLTKEEQNRILNDGTLVMRLSFKIVSSSYRYVYEFYRGDDRRVLVRIYQADESGAVKTTPVSDFYITTFAFKKIVRSFDGLLNGEIVNTDQGYED